MITSTGNGKVKRLVQLGTSARARNEAGVFLAEGPRIFREIPEEDLTGIFVSESFMAENARSFPAGVPVEVLTDRVFAHAADTETPQGILAVVRQKQASFREITNASAPFLLVLERIQNPGNLGTMLRTAECAGVTGIMISKDSADIYNPKTVRGSMGSVLRVPVLCMDDLTEGVRMLKESGIRVFAASLDGKNAYCEECYTGGTAFLIGSEGSGLSKKLSACADVQVRIPMEGRAESLNAAAASAVLMYEVHRQRM
mgnify:CR=1 FL=1